MLCNILWGDSMRTSPAVSEAVAYLGIGRLELSDLVHWNVVGGITVGSLVCS